MNEKEDYYDTRQILRLVVSAQVSFLAKSSWPRDILDI